MFQGRAERPANAIPVCWTVWGTRRDSWIVDSDPENGLTSEVVRDIFGFQITEETWVITNVWDEGDEFYEQRSVQQVDYCHGIRFQHGACLHMYDDTYDCALMEVISVRSALHFVHLWKRNTKLKLRRRAAVWPLFLLGRKRRIPPGIIRNVYVFIRPCHPK